MDVNSEEFQLYLRSRVAENANRSQPGDDRYYEGRAMALSDLLDEIEQGAFG